MSALLFQMYFALLPALTTSPIRKARSCGVATQSWSFRDSQFRQWQYQETLLTEVRSKETDTWKETKIYPPTRNGVYKLMWMARMHWQGCFTCPKPIMSALRKIGPGR